jgi:hypothetical protein
MRTGRKRRCSVDTSARLQAMQRCRARGISPTHTYALVARFLSAGKNYLVLELPEDILHAVAASPGPLTSVQSSGEIYSGEEGRRKHSPEQSPNLQGWCFKS